MQPIKILLGADMLLVRQALRALLEGEADFLLVGESADPADTIDLVGKLTPDIVLLDQEMLAASFDWLRDLRRIAPATRLVVLSSGCGKGAAPEELTRNIAGLVYRTNGHPTLVNAIRRVAAGNLYSSDTLSAPDAQASLMETREPSPSSGDLLSVRQRQVLELAARGFTNREIALRLSISPRTVEVHRAKLMHKLALRDRADLIRFAFRSARFLPDGLSEENPSK